MDNQKKEWSPLKRKICFILFLLMLVLAAIFAYFLPVPDAKASGIPVLCENCSDKMIQMLDRTTNLDQLANLVSQLNEMVTQTEQQIMLVKSEMERIASLPGDMIDEFKGKLADLARLTDSLNVQRGDASALADIYRQVFPDLDTIFGIVDENPNAMQERWKDMSRRSDEAIQAVFQISGQQLNSLVKDRPALENHINELLNQTSEIKIAQSANQLSYLMLTETQQLKALLATQAQQGAIKAAQEQKEAQAADKRWEDATKVNPITKPIPDNTPVDF